jgi:hypothetical protein
MRAGERAYIHEQLQARFGDTYLLTEEFLEVFIKITDLNNENRAWVYSFLDGILNPNISFSVAELFDFTDSFYVSDILLLKINRNDAEYFGNRIKLNGAIKLDGKTLNDKVVFRGKINGVFKCNGFLSLNGLGKTAPDHQPTPPFKLSSGIVDKLVVEAHGNSVNEQFDLSEAVFIAMRKHHKLNGKYKCNGSIKLDSEVLIPIG